MEQTLKTAREIVAGFSGVPTPLLGSADNSKYSNLEYYRAWVYENTIIPQLKAWESIITSRLCGPREIAVFDISEIRALYKSHKAEVDNLHKRTLAFKELVTQGISMDDALTITGLDKYPKAQ